jgi:hypothetical protein
MLENQLKQYLLEHEPLLRDLRLVRNLKLPQCYIAAGYIRNYVWDKLHGFPDRARHNDIDVVYFDPHYITEDRDTGFETALRSETGNDKWSVKNQARMHLKNDDKPYQTALDALSRWPEVVTAIGVRMDDKDHLHICSPYGLDDLFNMIVRRSPLFNDKTYYLERVRKKNWKGQWPLLTIMEE